jgi:hypothetical protein
MITITYAVNSYYNSHNGKPSFNNEVDELVFFAKLNSSFNNKTGTPDDLMNDIRQGYSITSALRVPYRHSDNFLSSQVFMLDFDKNVNKEDLITAYSHLAWGMYTTPSHTSAYPKWRVLFVLDKVVTSPEKYVLGVKALLYKAKQKADKACKDPVRFFFGMGSVDAEDVVFGNILSSSTVGEWVTEFKQSGEYSKHEYVIPENHVVLQPSSYTRDFAIRVVNKLGQHILNAGDGEKHHTRFYMAFTAGGYVHHLSKNEALSILMIYAMRNTNLSERQIMKKLSDGWEMGKNYVIPITEPKLVVAQPPTVLRTDEYWNGFADGVSAMLDAFGMKHDGDKLLCPLKPYGIDDVVNTEIVADDTRAYSTDIAAPFTPDGQNEYLHHIICSSASTAVKGVSKYPGVKAVWSSMPNLNELQPPNPEHWPPMQNTVILLEPNQSYHLGALSNAKKIIRTPGSVDRIMDVYDETRFRTLLRS